MRINHNIAALNTYRQLTLGQSAAAKNMEKLSSGLRINRAGDDAAGLAISEKMRGQIRGLEQASRNAQDGISLLQTAEGALNETHSILQRMRELAVQSANDTSTADDRAKIQAEVDELAKEITRIANTTEFNTQKLLTGGIKNGNIGELKFHIGANQSQDISLSINAMDAFSLGVAGSKATASVTSAGTNNVISSATIARDFGTGIVNGSTIGITVSDVAAANGTTGVITLGSNSLTISTSTQTDALNGYTIKFSDSNAALATSIDTTNKVITVTGDWNNSASAAPSAMSDVQNSINAALSSAGFTAQLSLTGTAGVADLASASASGYTIANGSDGSLTAVTFNNGSVSQTVNVKDTDKAVTVSSGAYKGLTVNLATGKQVSDMAGTMQLSVSVSGSSAASFTNGSMSKEASAAAGINVSTQSAAGAAITTIDEAIKKVSEERSKLGAYQNRLEHTINNLSTASENLTASESRIRDVDYALAA